MHVLNVWWMSQTAVWIRSMECKHTRTNTERQQQQRQSQKTALQWQRPPQQSKQIRGDPHNNAVTATDAATENTSVGRISGRLTKTKHASANETNRNVHVDRRREGMVAEHKSVARKFMIRIEEHPDSAVWSTNSVATTEVQTIRGNATIRACVLHACAWPWPWPWPWPHVKTGNRRCVCVAESKSQ